MKLFGYLIDSILTPETKFVATAYRFIDSIGESYPAFVSLNQDGEIIRELIIIQESRLNGRKIQEGYKYVVSSNSDGKLSSLSDCDIIAIGIRAKKMENFNAISTQLRFFGFKSNSLNKILIVNDVPVLAKNKEDLIMQLNEFLAHWNVHINNIPDIIYNVNIEKSKVRAKLLDIDYLKLLL